MFAAGLQLTININIIIMPYSLLIDGCVNTVFQMYQIRNVKQFKKLL